MKTRIVEATNGFNWGKFCVAYFDAEWTDRSKIPEEEGLLVLRSQGWTAQHVWVLDLATGEGAFFKPGGYAKGDLEKHRIWVCPLFEPFLEWLYTVPRPKFGMIDLAALPPIVHLPNAPAAMQGYRRPGPDHHG
jgi:hypothetical protein